MHGALNIQEGDLHVVNVVPFGICVAKNITENGEEEISSVRKMSCKNKKKLLGV